MKVWKLLLKDSKDIGDILTLFNEVNPWFMLAKPGSVVTANLIPNEDTIFLVDSSYRPTG